MYIRCTQNLFNVQEKKCMRILGFFQFPKSLKDILQECFITALFNLLLLFPCSFVNTEEVYVFTFLTGSSLNVALYLRD